MSKRRKTKWWHDPDVLALAYCFLAPLATVLGIMLGVWLS
jgi:hypothetical protein